jgi:hypothetical protein
MFFEKKVDMRSRLSMEQFLAGHYSYYERRGYSVANEVRFRRLGLNAEQMGKAWDLRRLEDGFWDEISLPVREFERETGGAYTVSPAGRSGGYLVLHTSHYRYLDYKSVCTKCRQLNVQIAGDDGKCGVCGSLRRNLESPMRTLQIGPEVPRTSMAEAKEMTLEDLRAKVAVVREFDRVCDRVREEFLEFVKNYAVEEVTVMVPRKITRLVPA